MSQIATALPLHISMEDIKTCSTGNILFDSISLALSIASVGQLGKTPLLHGSIAMFRLQYIEINSSPL